MDKLITFLAAVPLGTAARVNKNPPAGFVQFPAGMVALLEIYSKGFAEK